LLGRWSGQLRKNCAGANMVYSRAESVFVLEHYFSSKSFAIVRETFVVSNAYPYKEVPNKTTVHKLVTKFRDKGSVCHKCSSNDETAEITPYRFKAMQQIQQRDTAARFQYYHCFRRFVRDGVMCSS
jgi:hypothetical protein